MSRPDFTNLTERLLRGGIAPRHAARYVRELGDHFDDVVEEAVAAGATRADAEANAHARLGDDDALLENALARPELKSWGARWPWAVYGLGAMAGTFAIFFGYVLALILVMNALKFLGLIPQTSEQWTDLYGPGRYALQSYAFFGKHILALLIATGIIIAATRQRTAVKWAALGGGLIAIIGGGIDIGFTFPEMIGDKGTFYFGFGFFPPFPDPLNTVFRGLMNLAFLSPLLWRHVQIMQ